jgi:SAM-dependent methyltransferase
MSHAPRANAAPSLLTSPGSDLHERARWVFQHLPPNTARLLDVGCHDGGYTSGFASRTTQAVGIDVDVRALRAGQHRYRSVLLVAASAAALPFPTASFDCVVFSEVLEHLPTSMEQTCIAELRRVLRPRGTLLLTTPHLGSFWWLDPLMLKTHLRRLGAGVRGRRIQLKGHKHYRTEELHALLEPCFEIQSLERFGCWLYPLAYWGHLLPLGVGRTPALVRFWQWMMDYDYRRPRGDAAYNVCVVARARDQEAGDLCGSE